jgi:hypothetical protein
MCRAPPKNHVSRNSYSRGILDAWKVKVGASKLARKSFPVFGPPSFRLSSCYILAQEDFTRAKNREKNRGNFGPFWTR